MTQKTPLPPQKTLDYFFTYEPDTGKVFWKNPPSRIKNNYKNRYSDDPIEAFTYRENGYLYGNINSKKYRAHRIIWKMVHGYDPDIVDHINGNRSDNRIENLRDVSPAENARNRGVSPASLSGVMGVNWDRMSFRWTATKHGKFIGSFVDLSDAINAVNSLGHDPKFHKNHGKRKAYSSK